MSNRGQAGHEPISSLSPPLDHLFILIYSERLRQEEIGPAVLVPGKGKPDILMLSSDFSHMPPSPPSFAPFGCP